MSKKSKKTAKGEAQQSKLCNDPDFQELAALGSNLTCQSDRQMVNDAINEFNACKMQKISGPTPSEFPSCKVAGISAEGPPMLDDAGSSFDQDDSTLLASSSRSILPGDEGVAGSSGSLCKGLQDQKAKTIFESIHKQTWNKESKTRSTRLLNYAERDIVEDPEVIRKEKMETKMGRLSRDSYTIGQHHLAPTTGESQFSTEEVDCMRSMWLSDNWEGLVSPCEMLTLDHFIACLPDNTRAKKIVERSLLANTHLLAAKAVKYRSHPSTIPMFRELIQSTTYQFVMVPSELQDLVASHTRASTDCLNRFQVLYQEQIVALNGMHDLVKGLKTGVTDLGASMEHKGNQLIKTAASVIGASDDKTGEAMAMRARTPSIMGSSPSNSRTYVPSVTSKSTEVPPTRATKSTSAQKLERMKKDYLAKQAKSRAEQE